MRVSLRLLQRDRAEKREEERGSSRKINNLFKRELRVKRLFLLVVLGLDAGVEDQLGKVALL